MSPCSRFSLLASQFVFRFGSRFTIGTEKCEQHAWFQGSVAEIAIQDRAVGVDAAVPEKRPVAAHRLDQRRIAPRNDDLLGFARLGDVAAERISDDSSWKPWD